MSCLKKIGITLLLIALLQPGFATTKHKKKSVKKIATTHTHSTQKHHNPSHSIKVSKHHARHVPASVKHEAVKTTKKIIHKDIQTAHTQKHTVRKKPAPMVTKQPIRPTVRVNSTYISHSFLPTYLLNSVEKTLVHFVRNTIESIRYTTYKLGGTRIEPSRGIYVVDCSSYVDHILKTIYPDAYSSLTRWSGTQKPTTYDFYHYFRNLTDDSTHWNSVNDVEQLRPGDILVFRNKNRFGSETGGHVMIVMDKPERNGNTFLLRIADSAPTGHTQDTRLPHGSGIGIGTMLLKVNPNTSLPSAYAWKIGSRWETNVNFAMARPVNSG